MSKKIIYQIIYILKTERVFRQIYFMKKYQKTLSLEDLTSHQQRIRSIITNINQYSPTFHINSTYNHSQIISKLKIRREEQENRLFQQNLSIIQKLQNIKPKVDTKAFPHVNLRIRSKRKCNSLSAPKFKQTAKKSTKQKTQDELFQENIAMIEKLQAVDKKVKCWQDKSLLKSKVIREKKQKQRRNQILQKFKEISKEMKILKMSTDYSRLKGLSPYVNDKKVRRQSQASHQTNANSFLTK